MSESLRKWGLIGGGVIVAVGAALTLTGVMTAAHSFLALSGLGASAALLMLWGILAPLLGLEGVGLMGLTDAQRNRLELLRQKDTVLSTMKELEFDRDMGKLSDEDFAQMRADLENDAIRAMRSLDKEQRRYELDIRAEVRRRLHGKGVEVPETTAPPTRAGKAAAVAPEAAAEATAASSGAESQAEGAVTAAPTPSTAVTAATTAPTGDSEADVFQKIEKLADLRDRGVISDDDFDTKKRELLERI